MVQLDLPKDQNVDKVATQHQNYLHLKNELSLLLNIDMVYCYRYYTIY